MPRGPIVLFDARILKLGCTKYRCDGSHKDGTMNRQIDYSMGTDSKTSLPDQGEIEEAVKILKSKNFARVVNFSDIVNRYVDIVFKDSFDWFKAIALIVIVYVGKGSMMTTTLSKHLLRPKQGITKLTDMLEKEGLIIRERPKEDRRTINLRVTSLGLSYVRTCLSSIDIADAMLRSCLNRSEMDTFFALMRKVRRETVREVRNKMTKVRKANT
jgi:DNA-binding MarR family transcriptional regulator